MNKNTLKVVHLKVFALERFSSSDLAFQLEGRVPRQNKYDFWNQHRRMLHGANFREGLRLSSTIKLDAVSWLHRHVRDRV